MKKMLVILASFLMFSMPAFAISGNVYYSSHTATADTTKALCTSSIPGIFGSTNKAIINSVCVNTGATTSSVTLYNSSGTAVNTLAVVDATSKGCLSYNVILSSGITYTTAGTADITMMYQCY